VVKHHGHLTYIVPCSDESSDPKKQCIPEIQGSNVLYYLVVAQDLVGVRKIIDRNLNQINKTSNGYSPLHVAALNGDLEMLELLTSHGADLNIRSSNSEGWGPLHIAADQKKIEIARLLIAQGADLNLQSSKKGWTPLYLAVVNGNYQMAQFLIEKGSEVNLPSRQTLWTPLHEAVLRRRKDLVELLLNANANPRSKSKSLMSPIDLAKKNKQKEILDLLYKHSLISQANL
jgi:ankyrin repeat protein